jgi:hypothetical protein
VRAFVRTVANPAGERGTARWNGRLCVGVVNLQTQAARFLADRVSAVAVELGLEPGPPGCRPTLVIMMTTDGAALARDLVQSRRRELFTSVSGATAGGDALADFQQSDRAVRWWHVSLPIDPDTGLTTVRVPGQLPFQGMANGGTRPSDFGNAVSTVMPSRTSSPVKDYLQQALVIVDVTRLDGVDSGQLSDYLAMVGLAQIDPRAATESFDSILNLFDPESSAPPGLTAFDWAYLHGLYAAPQVAITGPGRLGEVAAGMERELQDGR